jgi:hypothetical protein
VTFGIDTSATDFVIAPSEEQLADALAGRLAVLAGCGSACRVEAKLVVSATTARRLGLRARGSTRSVSIGRSSARLSANAARALSVPLSRRARSALRRVRSVTATLSVATSAGGRALTLRPSIKLHRRAGLRRIARSGLRLSGACSEACTLRAGLAIDAARARRLGLNPSGGAPVTIAGGTARASSSGSGLTLRLSRSARNAVLRARTLTPTLETFVGASTGPEQRTARRLTLRR